MLFRVESSPGWVLESLARNQEASARQHLNSKTLEDCALKASVPTARWGSGFLGFRVLLGFIRFIIGFRA